ncbi:curli production assembly/transport outer membrane lipoprotein CsgG [Oleiphilus messinensis]|uniref:Curli production assembly/transport outer membrane lipoprotein CsgG n=1 Tax=Oleiphilus messinensis TaxID=141451 RepID=A0A1Y0IH24_9GAMM|nr:CsgG/HfaB family protein [Oleiphilus messinensis]ARU59146.1 curli production assembly/transport outer membrane lipoprotein CsgG [Oleiphilus messinensis]
MLRLKWLTMLLLAISPFFVVAETIEREILVDGFGASFNVATQNALIESVKQANGVSIDSQKIYTKAIKEQSVVSADESTHDVSINNDSLYNIKESTQGTINSYEIVQADNTEVDQWHVQVKVVLVEYVTPGNSPHSLRKIAVLPVRTKFSEIRVVNKTFSNAEIVRQYNQKLVNELTQSRRFSVMDRDYMDEYIKERDLLLSPDSSQDEQMKIGEALGVDYLLIGTVTEFKAETQQKYSKTMGQTTNNSIMQFYADYRIMVMATRQVKWSDTVKVTLMQPEIEPYARSNDDQGLIDLILERAARKVVHSSLDNIYPLKVLKVAGESAIYLNQGGKMTSVGGHYEVFTPGDLITDPDTGLNIKIDGEKVAAIEVTKVQSKYSLAKLLSGSLASIEPGAIVRRVIPLTVKSSNIQEVMEPAW